ncbi:MAG: hypothetical protein RL329_61 [Bacteroidota bacterium]|jgi:hypothetical protein
MSSFTQMPLNEAQVEILKLFAGGLTAPQIKSLRQLLISFKFKLLDEAVEKAAKERNITDAYVEKALSEHWRTPYRRKATGQSFEIVVVPLAPPEASSEANRVNPDVILVDANKVIVVVPQPTSISEILPIDSSKPINPPLKTNSDLKSL